MRLASFGFNHESDFVSFLIFLKLYELVGWITSLLPIYIKKAYCDNPLFSDTKVIYSIYDDDFEEPMDKDFANKIKLEGINSKDLKHYKGANYVSVIKAAIDFSDGVILGSPKVNPELVSYLKEIDKPYLEYQPMDRYIDAYNDFYEEVMVNDPVTVD